MTMQTAHWRSKAEGEAWAERLIAQINRPSLVLLRGPMGAGKTQVVSWFLKALGFPQGTSPTFAIHQEYWHEGQKIDHVDLYRLTSDADLESSGFWDLLTDPSGLLFVEWADRLPEEVWPRHWQRLELELALGASSEQREIRYLLTPPASP